MSKRILPIALLLVVFAAACSDSGDEAVATLTTRTAEVEVLSGGGATISYEIALPDTLELESGGSGSFHTWSDPDAEIGDRDVRVTVIGSPSADDTAALIERTTRDRDDVTVIDRADDADDAEGWAWFTHSSPSTSDPDLIAFASADASRALDDGNALLCTAQTQYGLDDDWTAEEAAAVADQMLAVCESLSGT